MARTKTMKDFGLMSLCFFLVVLEHHYRSSDVARRTGHFTLTSASTVEAAGHGFTKK